MATDNDIVKDFQEAYDDAYNVMGSLYTAGEEDLRMYLSAQWSSQDAMYYFEQGIPQHVINLIRRNIQALDGYQRRNRLSSVAIPLNARDQKTADEYSAVLQYVFQYGDGHTHISDAFKGGLITPINLLSVWVDYREDPQNGDIKFSVDPFNSFIFSPYFSSKDFSDCHFVAKRKWISPTQAESLCPEHEEEIRSLSGKTEGLDGKFSWLPYAQRPTVFPAYVAYTEYYTTDYKEELKIVDLVSGEILPWKKTKKEFKEIKERYPYIELIKGQKRVIKKHIIINDHYITTEENEWGLDEYPFVPFFGIYEKAALSYPLKMQSLVRLMSDPQKLLNKMMSYSLSMMGSQINSGWKFKTGALANEKAIADSGLSKFVPINDEYQMSDVEKITPSEIPQSCFEFIKILENFPTLMLGINEASFGISESGNESGILMQLRQGAALNSLQELFDNLRFAQKSLSRKILKITQQWTPAKLMQILGRAPTAEYYSPNFLKCDISIQESMLTETQRQMYFTQLVELYKLTSSSPMGSPITPMMLIEACPIQGGSQLVEEIKKNLEGQAKVAQEQQQLEKDYISTATQNLHASSLEKLALAKERLDKEKLNKSLEHEREAKVTRETFLNALDAMKALKEFEGVSEEDLVNFYLGFQKLNAMRVKADDKARDSVEEGLLSESNPLNQGYENEETRL